MFKKFLILLLIAITLKITKINGHGYLLIPPARSSAWRFDPIRFPIYYNDMEMNCGGRDVEWNQNNGSCGICGENSASKKRFEKGGDLYRGFIVRNYNPTQVKTIDVVVTLTVNHLGWFEFRLCNLDQETGFESEEATEECLNKHLLVDSATGKSRITVLPNQNNVTLSLLIPENFLCDHCVFQWKWNVGNSYDKDFNSDKNCLGCGRQEQFYGCSDISISNGMTSKTTTTTTTTPMTTTTKTTTNKELETTTELFISEATTTSTTTTESSQTETTMKPSKPCCCCCSCDCHSK